MNNNNKNNNNTDFLYFVPGNWFELKNISVDKTYPYDIETLKEEILNQVNDRSEKLSFINITIGSKYAKTTIESIDFYLDKEKFNNIKKIVSGEIRHPIITFHGTSNLNTVKSILKSGYIIPGSDDSIQSGIKMAHGSVHGIGVYSSPFFNKAIYYTTPDKIKYVYVLINICILGKAKLIPPSSQTYFDHKAPINGCYSDGSNTRIVYGLDQIVSADSNRIIPLAIMKISIA